MKSTNADIEKGGSNAARTCVCTSFLIQWSQRIPAKYRDILFVNINKRVWILVVPGIEAVWVPRIVDYNFVSEHCRMV